MWMLVPLLMVPLVVMGFMWALNRETFSFREFLVVEGVMVILLVVGFQGARYGAVTDTEIWNGRITAKESGTQKCCHCHQECDTCYRTSNGKTESYQCRCREVCTHFRDHWWRLSVSTGDSVEDTCSGSGSDPKWWTDAFVGEPAAIPHSYVNYLLAADDSVLFQKAMSTAQAPGYPYVHHRYKATRFLGGGTRAPAQSWVTALDGINADLGKPKQVNIIVVATTDPSPTYADAVEQQWLFGKKNDVIFVLGAPDGDTIAWAKVVSISNVEMLKLTARDQMPGMRLSNVPDTSGYIRDLVGAQFTRTAMAEYEYLWASVQPSTCSTVVLYVLALVGSIIGSLVMVHTDVFGDERRSRFRNRW